MVDRFIQFPEVGRISTFACEIDQHCEEFLNGELIHAVLRSRSGWRASLRHGQV